MLSVINLHMFQKGLITPPLHSIRSRHTPYRDVSKKDFRDPIHLIYGSSNPALSLIILKGTWLEPRKILAT